MADYAVVPYSNYTDAANLYTDGVKVVLYTTSNVRYAVAQRVSTNADIRTAFFRELNSSTVVQIISYKGNLTGSVYQTSLNNNQASITNTIVAPQSFGYYDVLECYFSQLYFTYNERFNTIDLTLFSNQIEALNAIWATPVVNPGVHVQFNPVYIPSFPGVHVHFAPALIDPNAQGGTSGTGGGDGTFDETSDAIPIPGLPEISTVDTGLVTLFRPSQAEIASLGSYLWTHLNDFWENLQKLFTNPMDYFIAFNIFPVVPEVLLSRRIYIGNWGTEITMPPVANQWYEFDCGTVTLQKYWGSALDYYPNTKVQLMLPYIGSVQLNTDEVMGQQIGVKYRIDLLSGSCVAMVTVNGNVYYQYTGECAVSVPLTGADWSRIYSAVVGAVGTAIAGGVGAVMTGSAGGAAMTAFATGKASHAVSSAGQTFAKLATEGKGIKGVQAAREAAVAAMQSAADAAKNAASASGTVAQGIRATRLANTVNNTVGQVMGAKTTIAHSGTISGSSGMLGVRDAYLIVEFPNQSLAQDYKHFVGYPSNIYARLGTLTGYTECEQVIAEGIWGTDDELAELVESLKGGVYL